MPGVGLEPTLFICSYEPLSQSMGNAASREVVGGQSDPHAIAWKQTNVPHARLTGHVTDDLPTVVELNAEHGVGQGFTHGPFHREWLGTLWATHST